jgi:hypothetical protein
MKLVEINHETGGKAFNDNSDGVAVGLPENRDFNVFAID